MQTMLAGKIVLANSFITDNHGKCNPR